MKKLTTLILLIFYSFLQAQSTSGSDIISFADKLLLRANINTQSESFSIVDNEERFTIEALNSFRLQLSANYKFIGFSIGFSPKNKNSDFKSKFFESQLQFFIKKQWIQTFNYSKVEGFYLENVQTLDIEEQFPNLKTTSWTGQTSYIYNQNYSLKHLSHQNEWQQYSSGSFVPSLKYGLNRISDTVDNEKYIQNNFDITLAPAYYYTWCLQENWFVSPNVSPALGIRFSKDKTTTTEVSNTYFTKALSVGLQFGYTSNKISAGATFNFNSNSINGSTTRELTNDKNYANLYFAYRIDPPAFLERAVTKISDKLSL
ncbi:DUF4421 family protein [Aurantibacter sp.]|uniref:DUF4421 family protein n=1 Tax=Aurantibacter sp. TaxID=2807103 RepID=UPI0035C810C8